MSNTLTLPQSRQPMYKSESSPAPRKTMIAKGHDAILKSLQDRGATIKVETMNGTAPIIGKMINRDRYTITVDTKIKGGTEVSRVTIYKHAIEMFSEVVSA